MLSKQREQIDAIDKELISLFRQRMAVVEDVARIKQENGLPVFDSAREQAMLNRYCDPDDPYVKPVSVMLRTMLSLSKQQQREFLAQDVELLPPPAAPVSPDQLVCAYQGVPGAWSEHALEQVFPGAKRIAVPYFQDVFQAILEGKADYGVVALENSQTGAIGETYDLLKKLNCYIVGRTTVDVRHCLMAPAGTRLEDIQKVYSHPQGFQQCASFLHPYKWQQNGCRNTAVAAQMAAQDSGTSAAIGSRRAAEQSGLDVLVADIMDNPENRTTFIVIAKEPQYDATSSLVAVTFSTAHRSGALCESLLPYMAEGINLMRIESRPDEHGSYQFFVELVGNINDPHMKSALDQAAATCGYFKVIGCYDNR